MKYLFISIKVILLVLITSLFISCDSKDHQPSFRSGKNVSVRGNTWVTSDIKGNETMISDSGITNWTDTGSVIKTYFSMERTGAISIAIRGRVKSGKSEIECTFGKKTKKISLSNRTFDTINVGTFNIV